MGLTLSFFILVDNEPATICGCIVTLLLTIITNTYPNMKKEKMTYDAPEVLIIELALEKLLLATSDPLYSNPYSGGGEDW